MNFQKNFSTSDSLENRIQFSDEFTKCGSVLVVPSSGQFVAHLQPDGPSQQFGTLSCRLGSCSLETRPSKIGEETRILFPKSQMPLKKLFQGSLTHRRTVALRSNTLTVAEFLVFGDGATIWIFFSKNGFQLISSKGALQNTDSLIPTHVKDICKWFWECRTGFDPGSGPFRGRVGRVHDADEVELSLGHGDGDLQVAEFVESKCELFDLKRY